MKKIILSILCVLLVGCSTSDSAQKQDITLIPLQNIETDYADGIYRGFYYDKQEEQVAIEFQVQNHCFSNLEFRTLSYLNKDYIADEDEITQQFIHCKDTLIGKDVSKLNEVYETDSTTGATLPVYTLFSALHDGLARGVYEPIQTTVFNTELSMPDGTYRGFYYDQNIEMVSVHFTLQNNRFKTFTLRSLKYTDANYLAEDASEEQKEVAEQFQECCDWLIGKDLSSLNDLYNTEDLDLISSATLNTSPLLSAVHNAFNRGVYRMEGNTALIVTEAEDGVYRGTYYDSGLEQIAVEFAIKDNTFTSFTIRSLNYKDGRYLAEDATSVQRSIARQFQQCADHLIGKNLSAVVDLYAPEKIADDMDAVSAATLRSNKMVSAIHDGFLRGLFANRHIKTTHNAPFLKDQLLNRIPHCALADGRFNHIRDHHFHFT